MYNFENYEHIVLLFIIAGVILMLAKFVHKKHTEDEHHSPLDI